MRVRGPSGLPAASAAGAAATGSGAAVVATAASACCTAPSLASLSVSVVGASGSAWAAGFAPLAGWMLGGSALLLAYGFWSIARSARGCLAAGAPTPRPLRLTRWALLLSTALWLVAVAVRLY